MFFLAAADGEDTFWIQLLVFMTLAAGWGMWMLVRSRAARLKRQADDEIIETIVSRTPSAVRHPSSCIHRNTRRDEGRRTKDEERDLKGGMELLDGAFLAEVVENTEAADAVDITMRRLAFLELMRRNGLGAVSSDALRAYTLDEGGLFDKSIRREAMAQLAKRTETLIIDD